MIGSHQDAAVLEECLRTHVRTSRDPRLAFTAGMLVERQRERRRAARAALPSSWKRVERAARKALA